MARQEAQTVASSLSAFMNGAGTTDIAELAEEILRDHRTLQQQTFGLMMTCIQKWSETENFDVRNDYTVKLCKKLMEAAKDDWFGRVPLI